MANAARVSLAAFIRRKALHTMSEDPTTSTRSQDDIADSALQNRQTGTQNRQASRQTDKISSHHDGVIGCLYQAKGRTIA
jgi:hypothetical protein